LIKIFGNLPIDNIVIMKKHNFSAGPCILPEEVLQQASKAVIDFNNDDLSLLEISHRSKPFVDVIENAKPFFT